MKTLLISAFKYSDEQISAIKSLGYDIINIQNEWEPLQIDCSEVDCVICNNLFLYNDISDFKSLKFIQLISVGLDRAPLDYIKANGIKLFNAKGVYSVPMAEWVVLKILEVYKKSIHFYKNQAEHKWQKSRELLELMDRNAAIIGFGRVGREIAKRLKAFDVKTIGVGRRNIETDLLDEYYLIENIDAVLKKSDIVILTLPLTDKTRHLIDKDRISVMKDGSVLVNVSRGSIINETDLIESIQLGKFLGVAIDVFEEEPLPQDSPLWTMENVIITPHNSFVSDKTSDRMFELAYKNLSDYISGSVKGDL